MSYITKRICVGADHGALDLKNTVKQYLESKGLEVVDHGTHTSDSCDYSDFANEISQDIALGYEDFGILFCTSGIGMSIAANRFRGVRASVVTEKQETVMTRKHNNANIACLGSAKVSPEQAIEIVEAFLTTEFEGGRHQRRLDKGSGSRLAVSDPEIFDVITKEEQRQRNHIELIASENFTSPAVMEAQGSLLTNKYAEGYPGKRWYGGCENVDVAESLAISRLKELFGAEHANVQPHSGSQANTAVYFSVLQPGDKILTMDLAHGGHLTHGHKANFSGRLYEVVHYGVNEETGRIDYDALEALAKSSQPKLITCGASAYSRTIDFERMGQIAKAVGAYLFVDMAHIAGLVAGGVHPSPVPYADFVTSTTHKSLRGPRGGFILCKEEYAKKIDGRVFPGVQGGPLMHVIAAKAVCFKEALKPDFKDYQAQIVKNAQTIANRLIEHGFEIVSNGTDNHVMLVDLRSKGVTGTEADAWLDEAGITINKNAIPFDTGSPMNPNGIRIGTPAITTRGVKECGAKQIADFINEAIETKGDQAKLDEIRARVFAFNQAYKLPR